MSDLVLVSIISASPGIITAILSFLNGRRQEKNHQENKAALEVVRQDVNGKMQQLVDVSGEAKRAEGNLEGRAELKRETLL